MYEYVILGFGLNNNIQLLDLQAESGGDAVNYRDPELKSCETNAVKLSETLDDERGLLFDYEQTEYEEK